MALEFKELKNQRSLSMALRNSSSSEIDEIINKLQDIQTEIKEREAKEQAVNQVKKEAIDKIVVLMKEYNITVDEVIAAGGFTHGRRGKMKNRYRYIALDGTERFWTGQGRLPRELLRAMERDGSTNKEDYRIKSDAAEAQPAEAEPAAPESEQETPAE